MHRSHPRAGENFPDRVSDGGIGGGAFIERAGGDSIEWTKKEVVCLAFSRKKLAAT